MTAAFKVSAAVPFVGGSSNGEGSSGTDEEPVTGFAGSCVDGDSLPGSVSFVAAWLFSEALTGTIVMGTIVPTAGAGGRDAGAASGSDAGARVGSSFEVGSSAETWDMFRPPIAPEREYAPFHHL